MNLDTREPTEPAVAEDRREWQAPRVIVAELGDAETQILAGTEAILYIS